MKDDVERTSDGRHIIVNGRKWRSTDPSIPEPLRAELVGELMASRREVHLRRADADLVRAARARVDDAKHALGERGDPWWEPLSEAGLDRRIRSTIRTLTSRRGPGKTICPSEVARAVASPDWRPTMERVRQIARELAADGVVFISASGRTLGPSEEPKGPIRIGCPATG